MALIIVFGVDKLMTSTHEKNHLSDERSPYLQQHANNPIWWYPWGDQAFDKAQELDIPIFLSVGLFHMSLVSCDGRAVL